MAEAKVHNTLPYESTSACALQPCPLVDLCRGRRCEYTLPDDMPPSVARQCCIKGHHAHPGLHRRHPGLHRRHPGLHRQHPGLHRHAHVQIALSVTHRWKHQPKRNTARCEPTSIPAASGHATPVHALHRARTHMRPSASHLVVRWRAAHRQPGPHRAGSWRPKTAPVSSVNTSRGGHHTPTRPPCLLDNSSWLLSTAEPISLHLANDARAEEGWTTCTQSAMRCDCALAHEAVHRQEAAAHMSGQ